MSRNAMSRKWTAEDDALIRAYAEEELPYAWLARRLGVSRNAIIGRAYRLGVKSPSLPVREEGQHPRSFDYNEAIRLREQGLSYRLIGEQLNVDLNTIACMFRRLRLRKAAA